MPVPSEDADAATPADVKLAPMSTSSPERSGLKYGGTGSKKLKRLDVHFASLKSIIG
jgi:hypothetical protein